MSIEADLAALCEGRQLWPIGRVSGLRRVFVTPDVYAVVSPPFDKGIEGRALNAMRARLDTFTDGGFIPFGWDPREKKPTAIFARVDPVGLGVISVRAKHGNQGVRVFGCMAKPDWYVGIHWEFRDDVGDFEQQAKDARRAYERIVGRPPHVGRTPDDCFTFNKLVV